MIIERVLITLARALFVDFRVSYSRILVAVIEVVYERCGKLTKGPLRNF